MKRFALLAALAVVVASCGADDAGSFDPNAGFTQGAEGELRALAYAYQPDSSLTYGFIMDMDVAMSADIDAPDAFNDMTMAMTMAGAIGYEIAPGPDEGTVRMSIESSLSEVSLSDLTVDGESIPPALMGLEDPAAAGLGEMIPPMTVTLDSSGAVLEMQVGDVAVPSELLNAFGGSGFADPTGMGMMGTLFGPELPADDVRIGATWTTTDTQEIPFVGEMTVITHHEIVGEESMAGRDTIVIVSTSQMPPLEMSFADMLEALQDPAMMAALGVPTEDIDTAQLEAELFESLDFDFSMKIIYDKVETTTWLDYDAGLMVATDGDIAMDVRMTIDTPDGGGTMTMNATVGLNMILTEDGAAT